MEKQQIDGLAIYVLGVAVVVLSIAYILKDSSKKDIPICQTYFVAYHIGAKSTTLTVSICSDADGHEVYRKIKSLIGKEECGVVSIDAISLLK